jgi:hypothetical protein
MDRKTVVLAGITLIMVLAVLYFVFAQKPATLIPQCSSLGTCNVKPSCLANYSLDGSICYKNGTFNSSLSTIVAPTTTIPGGGSNQATSTIVPCNQETGLGCPMPACPNNYIFNSTSDQCILINACPAGYYLSTSSVQSLCIRS